MILDFSFKNYKCKYFAGDKYYSFICFAQGYQGGIYNNNVYLTYTWPKGSQDELNYCLFDTTELRKYFTEISKLLGFKLLTLLEEERLYKLQIKCIDNDRYFRYISTYIRYVYEHPFSILLYAAWYNRHNFPGLNITQIIQYYITLFYKGPRCHCPGDTEYTFTNINTKCQFNLIRSHFNKINSLVYIKADHAYIVQNIIQTFNTKQLLQIIKWINSLANKYYVKNKKDICCW